MATISANSFNLLITTIITAASFHVTTFSASVIEDLNNLRPPPDFEATVANNCRTNPALRYCNNGAPFDLDEIFKFSIVASHLCNVSRNPNCIESFPKIDLRNQPKMAPLYLSFNCFWKYCPLTVLSIDLSNNSLQAEFPSEVFYCSQIQALDLSLNRFSGDVPVENFSYLKNLTFLNLSFNEFAECRISDARLFERFNSTSFINSGIIPNHSKFRAKAVAILVGFPVFVIAIVGFIGWFICLRQAGVSPSSEGKFTPSILEEATDGFAGRNLVGKTGRSGIYRGVLGDGTAVRIEVYFEDMTAERRRRFVEESKILVCVRHRNVVPVLGWCDSRRLKATVSEWIDGVDVGTWLTASGPPWSQRVKIILGIVSGVSYLHQEWPQLGFDLRTRNLVLTESEGEPIITRLKLRREHHGSAKKTYKLGLFVLQMVTGRRMDEFGDKERGFLEWVTMHHPGRVEGVIDGRMETTARAAAEAEEAVEFGLMCVDPTEHRILIPSPLVIVIPEFINWCRLWEGPYRVVAALPKRAYKLEHTNGEIVPKTWHVSNLRRYYL